MEYYINNLTLTKKGDSRMIMYGKWSMLFGNYKGKIFDYKGNELFSIKKKINIWKLKVNYFITDKWGKSLEIYGENKKHSIYVLKIDENIFELKLHKGNKKSLFYNYTQIAAIDEAIFLGKTTIITKSLEHLSEIFLMFFCLKIGENNKGITFNFGYIGKMEPIDLNWKP